MEIDTMLAADFERRLEENGKKNEESIKNIRRLSQEFSKKLREIISML